MFENSFYPCINIALIHSLQYLYLFLTLLLIPQFTHCYFSPTSSPPLKFISDDITSQRKFSELYFYQVTFTIQNWSNKYLIFISFYFRVTTHIKIHYLKLYVVVSYHFFQIPLLKENVQYSIFLLLFFQTHFH